MDYIQVLGNPLILVVDDYEYIRREYSESLAQAGFKVSTIEDGLFLEDMLKATLFDVILCDTEMPKMPGTAACSRAYESGLIVEDMLVIGMSDDSDNEQYWSGLAHYGCFHDKRRSYDIGEWVFGRLYNFRQGGAIWRRKLRDFS